MSLMAALAAGCSSDDIVDDGGKKPGTVDGESFVALNIKMPTTNGTRTENFEEGTPDEYKVEKIIITFYESENGGSTVGTALEYDANELSWVKDDVSGITTTALLPVKTVTFAPGTNYYALVEVNTPDKLAGNVKPTNDPQEITANELTGDAKNDFFMTNAIRHDGKYLVAVQSYNSALEAQTNAHLYTIYVERAVAKVELSVDGTNNWKKNTYTIPGEITNNVYAKSRIQIDGWKLDITNKKMYPIRNFEGKSNTTWAGDDYARFYGNATHRTYWAVDPNYDETTETQLTSDFNTASDYDNTVGYPKRVGEGENAYEAVAAGVEYCLENTFNTQHQKQHETTRVVVEATYTPNFAAGEKIDGPDGDGATWYTIGNSTKAYTKSSLIAKIKEVTGATNVSLASDLNAGETTIDNNTFTITGTSDDAVTKIQNVLGRTITTYKDGKCYYAIRIKHFGDELPWGETQGYPNYTMNSGMDAQYLGRYGVVRNNWYKVTIQQVNQPGSPTVPKASGDPDDVHDYYLQANISILDWAVREQGVIL